jgi:hypothetical protein
MATAADVQTVRENTNEEDGDTFSDEYISALVDAGSVASASAVIWTRKAGAFAELVNTSEAGASRALSDLHKNALTMAAKYETDAAGGATGIGRGKTHSIVRD